MAPRSSRVRLDLNSSQFQDDFFAMEAADLKQVVSALRRLRQMEWDVVYSHPGLNWEVVDHIKTPTGAKACSEVELAGRWLASKGSSSGTIFLYGNRCVKSVSNLFAPSVTIKTMLDWTQRPAVERAPPVKPLAPMTSLSKCPGTAARARCRW